MLNQIQIELRNLHSQSIQVVLADHCDVGSRRDVSRRHDDGCVAVTPAVSLCVSITSTSRWGGGGRGQAEVKPPIHFHCVLHTKRGWVGLGKKGRIAFFPAATTAFLV